VRVQKTYPLKIHRGRWEHRIEMGRHWGMAERPAVHSVKQPDKGQGGGVHILGKEHGRKKGRKLGGSGRRGGLDGRGQGGISITCDTSTKGTTQAMGGTMVQTEGLR